MRKGKWDGVPVNPLCPKCGTKSAYLCMPNWKIIIIPGCVCFCHNHVSITPQCHAWVKLYSPRLFFWRWSIYLLPRTSKVVFFNHAASSLGSVRFRSSPATFANWLWRNPTSGLWNISVQPFGSRLLTSRVSPNIWPAEQSISGDVRWKSRACYTSWPF